MKELINIKQLADDMFEAIANITRPQTFKKMEEEEIIMRAEAINKMIVLLKKEQKQYTHKYVNHIGEVYFGSRTANIHNDMVRISIALKDHQEMELDEVAKTLMHESMSRDYWYTFVKNWN